jgi:predicted dehydrogenase
MPWNIAIVGAGGLGRRHMEALSHSPNDLRIHVVDPGEASLKLAREHAAKVFKDTEHLSFHAVPRDLPRELDLAVIATNADVRRSAFEDLLAVAKPRYIVFEKVLFQRVADYQAVAERLAAEGIAAWVNCPRRMWPYYIKLREELAAAPTLSMYAMTSPETGLGSNAIHMIDLLAFLARESDITVDASRVKLYPGPTKRAGIELTGTLVATTKKGAVLVYTSQPSGNNPLKIDIEAPDQRYVIEESAEMLHRADKAGGWKWQSEKADAVYQSRLTNIVADQLIASGTCDLTPYAESMTLHLPMIRAMSERLKSLGQPNAGEVKIT